MESYRTHTLPEASADIINLFEYIEANSPQNARLVAQRLYDAIDSLQTMPYRGTVHLKTKSPRKKVYAMLVAPFIIYYRIIEADRIIEILTVRHAARKQPRRFRAQM